MVYLHAKYAKPVLNKKKVTARTLFVTDGQTDHYRASATKWRGPNYWSLGTSCDFQVYHMIWSSSPIRQKSHDRYITWFSFVHKMDHPLLDINHMTYRYITWFSLVNKMVPCQFIVAIFTHGSLLFRYCYMYSVFCMIWNKTIFEWLFNANIEIVQLYHGGNKFIFNEMIMRSTLY